jgi:hypothetical protein
VAQQICDVQQGESGSVRVDHTSSGWHRFLCWEISRGTVFAICNKKRIGLVEGTDIVLGAEIKRSRTKE